MVRLYTRNESPFWYAEVDIGGTPWRFSTQVPRGPRNRRRALEAAEAARDQREADRVRATSVSLEETVALFFQHVHHLKDSTKGHYQKKLIDVLDSSLGSEPLVSITPDRLKAYIRERRDQTSDIQIRHELTALSSVLEWAVEWGVEGAPEVNPVRMTRKKGLAKPASHSRAVEPAQVADILAAAKETSPKFWHPFLTVILETGMRHEEALGLQWPSVDLARGVINLEWHRVKTKKSRIVPLSDVAQRTLAAQERYVRCDYVFTNPRTMKRYTSIWKGWGRLREKANCSDVRIHDFRHTFASYTRRLGMDRMDRKAIMGHSSEASHELYAATNEPALRRVMNEFSPSTLLAQERELGAKVKNEDE